MVLDCFVQGGWVGVIFSFSPVWKKWPGKRNGRCGNFLRICFVFGTYAVFRVGVHFGLGCHFSGGVFKRVAYL